MTPPKHVDLFIIGGGVNGTGIARDASGRGISVALAEMNDLGSATSSASTKLFHGGLRYLEFFEFRLVREALIERETLLRAMPHISWPMRFVLPYHRDMRFDNDTPTSRLLGVVMPWMHGRRPAWLIRVGLFMYDHLGGRKILPATSRIDLGHDPAGAPLKPHLKHAYEYSDCGVDDARLVVLNARAAHGNGAHIMPRHMVVSANENNGIWEIEIRNMANGETHITTADMVVNATGPWVEQTLRKTLNHDTNDRVRLVRGSHIITRKLFDHDKCYFFQGTDGRIIFAIPYEQDFTLIGTTDADHDTPDIAPVCTDPEADYLRDFAGQYFRKPIDKSDIVATYSGTRPLFDDGANSATAATREYVLRMDNTSGAPLLNVFGGKITTYRKLAEAAMDHIGAQLFTGATFPKNWTAGVPLPGGDFPHDGVNDLIAKFANAHPWADARTARRIIRAYGTDAFDIFAGFDADNNHHFGHGVYAAEIDWTIAHEWVQCGDDYLWRRSKMGLRFSPQEAENIDAYITSK